MAFSHLIFSNEIFPITTGIHTQFSTAFCLSMKTVQVILGNALSKWLAIKRNYTQAYDLCP